MKGIESVTYGTIPGGMNSGVMAFQVAFDGEAFSDDLTEIVNLVYAIKKWRQGAGKNLYIEGTFNLKNETGVYTFVRAMHDAGYVIGAKVSGQIYFQWMGSDGNERLINWLIVEAGPAGWVGYNCQEFRYRLESVDQEEPILPENHRVARLYLIPSEEASSDQVMEYVKKSEIPWNIYVESDEFYGEEVEL